MKHPPFCPNKECKNYHYPEGRWYVKFGSYQTHVSGKVQRFKCRSCGMEFSERTFSIDYHTHKKISYKTILQHLVTSSGIRDLSRILNISCTTITNRMGRLARQAIAISAELSHDIKLNEDLVADGIESFVKSQYMPNNINILSGKKSQFWFMSDYAQITRKGKMTPKQKEKNILISDKIKLNRVSIYKSFTEVIHKALELHNNSERECTNFYTDKHHSYIAVIKDTFTKDDELILNHIQISSKKARTVTNPLFSVNYLDREIRKDNSDHIRETVQFARNVNNLMERLAIYRFYHNFIKPYRINHDTFRGETHASMAGIPKRGIHLEVRTMLTQRRFLGQHWIMDNSERRLWFRSLVTPLARCGDSHPGYILA